MGGGDSTPPAEATAKGSALYPRNPPEESDCAAGRHHADDSGQAVSLLQRTYRAADWAGSPRVLQPGNAGTADRLRCEPSELFLCGPSGTAGYERHQRAARGSQPAPQG